MANSKPNMNGLVQNVAKRKKASAQRRMDKQKQLNKERSEAAIEFCGNLDHQIELMVLQLHRTPWDKDLARNLQVFMKYKALRDKSTDKSFMDMEF